MQKMTLIRDIQASPESFSDKEILVSGWIRTVRDQKQFAFINLADGSHFEPLQLVALRENLNNYDEVVKFGNGAAIVARGVLHLTPDARQAFELKVLELTLEGDCPPDYPLQPKRHSAEFLRSIAHLRPRANLFQAVFRVRSEAAFAIHEFFNSRGFVYVNTPLITASDCEGAGEMFAVTTLDLKESPRREDGEVDYSKDFFGKAAYLTVSGQLSGECYAQAFRNIYTFGPTFRAEDSHTARHAAEFWMIEPEIAFADLGDNMCLAEAMMKHVIRHVLAKCAPEIDFFNQHVDQGLKERLNHVLNSDFAVLSYTEAVRILEESGQKFEYPVSWGVELQTEHERYLTEQYLKKPVFVINYPKGFKAFYMRLNDDGQTVAAMDLLVPGIGEIIGGSQREERLEYMENRLRELNLNPEDYWWYLELRKYGSTHHAGYGLGFERLIMYLTGVSNIRDVIPFPRTAGTAEF